MNEQDKADSGQNPILRRGREVIGLPVISIKDGSSPGKVTDILYRRDGGVAGFLIADADNQKGFIPIAAATGVGSGAVIIEDPVEIREPEPEFESGAAAADGAKVITANGDEIGLIQDIAVDLSSGKVMGLELSDGLIRDVLSGRTLIPLEGVITWGPEVMIVDNRYMDIWNQDQE